MGKTYQKASNTELKIIDDTPIETVVSLSDLKNKKQILESNKSSLTVNYNKDITRLNGQIDDVDVLIVEAGKLNIVDVE